MVPNPTRRCLSEKRQGDSSHDGSLDFSGVKIEDLVIEGSPEWCVRC